MSPITIKSKEEIAILREGGKRLARILKAVSEAVRPGISSKELNDIAERLVKEGGDKSAFLNYKPYGAKRPYPASLCVSINDEVVHGIPNEKEKILKEGDIVSLDMGLIHGGLYTDGAITIPVGKIDDASQKLLSVTHEALMQGIAQARVGNTTEDIAIAIESHIKPHGYGIVEELAGHGVGYAVHEPPYIPNYTSGARAEKLKAGMVIAIEPMVNEGTKKLILDKDGYTYRTKDGKRSAHFEHTVVITDGDPLVVTLLS